MPVALDARRLQDDTLTGVGRGLVNLLPHLQGAADIVLLTDARRRPAAIDGLQEVPLQVPGRLPEPFWLQIAAARWLRGFNGVFHGPYNALPLAYRGPSVVTIHDLSWEDHPEDFSWARRLSFMSQARLSVRRAGVVLTVSEFIRDRIMATYGVGADRVLLAPNAVDPVFSPDRAADLAPIRTRLGLPERYVVALGGAARRGAEVALEAWQTLGEDRPGLVLVGDGTSVAPGVVSTGQLGDAEWATVLAGAEAFCYPTRYEGFGMPALEAAASGTPVVCARLGPLPEVLGDAAEWCRSTSAVDVAAGLSRVLGDDGRRAALRQAGLARAAAAPTWQESAAAVLRAYEMALS